MNLKPLSHILLGLIIASSLLLIAAAPEWIQYNERVVGENSPYFDDVVNRPMKQIWGNFTSQHDTNGGHKTSIFPTPIPTAVFPTPLPTATPGPDFPTPLPTATPGPDFPTPLPTATPGPEFPTPLPTATPGPDFPTPLPTATPIPAQELLDFGDIEITAYPYTVLGTNGGCYGRLLIAATGAGTITLPSVTDIAAYGCHSIRLVVTQTAGTTTVAAGSGTSIVMVWQPTGVASISSEAEGSSVQLAYSPTLDGWVVLSMHGIWATP